MTQKLAILGSTRGSNLQFILEAIADQILDARVEVVVSNRADAYILERARQHGIPHHHVPVNGQSREAYDRQVQQILSHYTIDLILMIGYMRIASAWFVAQWPRKILNIHPSLLPKHAGLMDLAVHQAVLDAGDTETGCTVHFVEPIVDGGEIVLQRACAVGPADTVTSLKQKVQHLEQAALLDSIKMTRRH